MQIKKRTGAILEIVIIFKIPFNVQYFVFLIFIHSSETIIQLQKNNLFTFVFNTVLQLQGAVEGPGAV